MLRSVLTMEIKLLESVKGPLYI